MSSKSPITNQISTATIMIDKQISNTEGWLSSVDNTHLMVAKIAKRRCKAEAEAVPNVITIAKQASNTEGWLPSVDGIHLMVAKMIKRGCKSRSSSSALLSLLNSSTEGNQHSILDARLVIVMMRLFEETNDSNA